jgi:hypothetical protein
MSKPPKDKSEIFAKRTISVPPDIDGIIEQEAYDNHDTYSGRVVKRVRWSYGLDDTQNDSCETQGKQNGR